MYAKTYSHGFFCSKIAGCIQEQTLITGMQQAESKSGLTESVGKLLTTRGVQTGPGAITLHLIFFGASSVAMPLVIVVIAPYIRSAQLNLPLVLSMST